MSEKQLLLKVENLYVSYEDTSVLENVSLEIHANDFIGIIGPNGGGKTTLLKSILGLKSALKGNVQLVGEMTQNQLGYLPQIKDFDQKFPYNVFEVVRSGLLSDKTLMKRFSKSDRQKTEAALEQVGIAHLKDRPIGNLSGGQMQRVFLARAIVSEPKILFLDEPNTFVDSKFERDLYEKLRMLNQEMAIVLVSHDLGTISSYVKSIACVNRTLHHHQSNIISKEQLENYDCPVQLITHGHVPHTVLQNHHQCNNHD